MNSSKQASKSPLISSPILAGVAFSIIWLAIGALVLSILLHFTSMKEAELNNSTLFVHAFAALAGGLTAGKRSEKKGWYYGVIMGVVYSLIVIIVSFLASNIAPSGRSALLLGAALLAGALGGMIGVNLRR